MSHPLSRRFLVVGALAAVGAAGAAVQAARSAAVVGQPAPAFSLRDADGRVRSLNEFRGKTVVLEWTNHDCPYVKKHYGSNTMQQLQRDARRDGAVWLSVVSSAPGKQGHVTPAQAKQLTTSRGAQPTAVLLDPTGAVGRAYDAKTTPHMFVINGAGRVVYAGGIDDKAPATPRTSARRVRWSAWRWPTSRPAVPWRCRSRSPTGAA